MNNHDNKNFKEHLSKAGREAKEALHIASKKASEHVKEVKLKDVELTFRRHSMKIITTIILIVALLPTSIMQNWNVFSLIAASCASLFFSTQCHQFIKTLTKKVLEQETAIRYVVGVLGLLLAIFVQPIIFIVLGIYAGKGIARTTSLIIEDLRSRD